jgi:NAD(P)-dependent dehydrogenase (short-subunit alcohol dehydrogenase family)
MDYMARFSLSGKKCVVSGAGAPHGIGIALASALACARADVILTDIVAGSLGAHTEGLRRMGVESHFYLCDITDQDSVSTLRDSVLDRFGRIDVLVNNAGAFQDVAAENMGYDDWRRVMSVNLDGNFNMSQAFGREMIRQGTGGSIIFVSSKSGITVDVPQRQLAYNTSKAGVIMMAKTLAVEWARYRIRVNSIAPGNIRTDGLQRMIDEKNPYIPAWVSMNPMQRIGETDELGNAAIFLASDASSYMTGETMLIDGGYCAL